MPRIKQGIITLLNGAIADGKGVAIDVSNYLTTVLQISTVDNTEATIKFAISMSTDMPDFSQAPSITNAYDYVQLRALNDGSTLDGSTGIVLTGTDMIQVFEVNSDLIKWICPIISGYSAGKINCEAEAVNDFTR